MDPAALDDPFYSYFVYNYSEIRLRINRVQPKHYSNDLPSFRGYLSADEESQLRLPGEELFDDIIQTNCEKDDPKEMKIFLKPFLRGDTPVGQLLILIQPTEKAYKACPNSRGYSEPTLSAWIQCTRLAGDVFLSSGNTTEIGTL